MKKKLKNILLISSVSVLFCFASCNTNVNPDIPKTPETEDKKLLGFEISIADSGMNYGATEVIFEEKTDNTIIETRTTTYKNGLVKTSVITSKPDATKTIVDTYSSGEKFEAEIAVNGSSTVKAYKNGTEIELKNCEFWDNKGYAGQFNYDHHLEDYIDSEDLIEGDVLHISYYGFARNDFENITCVIASGSEEDNWYLALSKYYGLDPLDKIYKNTSFVFNKDIPITETSVSDLKYFNLVSSSKYLSTESASNHPESKNILAYMTMEIDKNNRIPAAIINYETDGGILKTDDNKVYPGRYITATAEKPGLLFAGWFDGPEEDAEPVTKCPETEGAITLYAHWTTELDLLSMYKKNHNFNFSFLENYKDFYLTYSIDITEGVYEEYWNTTSLRSTESDISTDIHNDESKRSYAHIDSNPYVKTYSLSIEDILKTRNLNNKDYNILGFNYSPTRGTTLEKLCITTIKPEYINPFVYLEFDGADSHVGPDCFFAEENENLCNLVDIKCWQTPIKRGFTFGGWYFDQQFTDSIFDDFYYIITETITLYAKWIADSE